MANDYATVFRWLASATSADILAALPSDDDAAACERALHKVTSATSHTQHFSLPSLPPSLSLSLSLSLTERAFVVFK